jgi:hypothetical protein
LTVNTGGIDGEAARVLEDRSRTLGAVAHHLVDARPAYFEQVLKYLARYTHRVAISDRRIQSIDEHGVTFRYRDNGGGGQKSMTLDGPEFLRRFLLHVLPKGFVRIRYFGLLANRHRAQNLERCRALLRDATPTRSVPSATTSADSRATDAVERNRCTHCEIGLLQMLSTLAPAAVSALTVSTSVRKDTS